MNQNFVDLQAENKKELEAQDENFNFKVKNLQQQMTYAYEKIRHLQDVGGHGFNKEQVAKLLLRFEKVEKHQLECQVSCDVMHQQNKELKALHSHRLAKLDENFRNLAN
jgi:hypothetical protein